MHEVAANAATDELAERNEYYVTSAFTDAETVF